MFYQPTQLLIPTAVCGRCRPGRSRTQKQILNVFRSGSGTVSPILSEDRRTPVRGSISSQQNFTTILKTSAETNSCTSGHIPGEEIFISAAASHIRHRKAPAIPAHHGIRFSEPADKEIYHQWQYILSRLKFTA